jgi:ribonuclease BN (tRNA processing enzyme)
VAKQGNVKRLVLTHFDANWYRTMRDRKNAESEAKKIFEDTLAAYDGLEMEL